MQVVITVDTEPDNAWENHLNPSVANVKELVRLQELLDKYGAKATCLVTCRIVQNPECVEVLRELVDDGGAEIGAHLHPWETPPFMESGVDVRYPTYPHELSLEIFEQKLTYLTEAITERFGQPKVYRAGRWGLSPAHLPVLERLGYEVDTSVIPLEDWRNTPGVPRDLGGRGGIDYRFAPQQPYHPSYEDVTCVGEARVLEVPVTVGFTRCVWQVVRRRYGHLPVLTQRLLRKVGILRPVWAVPPQEHSDRLARMLRVVLSERPTVINVAMHSSELALGGCPWTCTPAQVDEVFRRVDKALALLADGGACKFQTLSGAARDWKARQEQPAQSGKTEAGSAGSTPIVVRESVRPGPLPALRLVYVLAASHSGSTLLAMLLGSHLDTCTVGELKATSLGDRDRYLCSCGVRIRQCEFWKRVSAGMAQRGCGSFDITDAGTDLRTGASWLTRRLLRPLHRGSAFERLRDTMLRLAPTWRSRLSDIQRRNRLLIGTLCELYGAQMIVDSSKIGLRLKYLLQDPALDVKVVRLIRDGRAVALTYHSPREFADARDPRRRRGGNVSQSVEKSCSMRSAAYEWRRSNEEAEHILGRLDKSQWTKVSYEELCAVPDQTLERLFRFLGLDPQQRTGNFRARAQHVVGNGMRLDSTAEIKLDDRWRSVLTRADLRDFDAVAGEMNCRYGYT